MMLSTTSMTMDMALMKDPDRIRVIDRVVSCDTRHQNLENYEWNWKKKTTCVILLLLHHSDVSSAKSKMALPRTHESPEVTAATASVR
jgi:hypothetical protein